MSSKNHQQKEPVKKEEQKTPAKTEGEVSEVQKTTDIDQAIEQDKQAKTTVQVTADTREKLDTLQKDLGQPDVNGTIAVLIEGFPGKESNDNEVVLVMPKQKFEWLKAWQRNSDCTDLLKASVR